MLFDQKRDMEMSTVGPPAQTCQVSSGTYQKCNKAGQLWRTAQGVMGWDTLVCFHASHKNRFLCEQILSQTPMASSWVSLAPLVLMEQAP